MKLIAIILFAIFIILCLGICLVAGGAGASWKPKTGDWRE